MRRPLEEARRQGKAATLLIFVTTDCPISNRAAPEVNRIAREYGQRNIACYVVQTDRALTLGEAKSHAKQYGFTCPVLLDKKHDLVRLAGASVTPEAAIISPSGQVLYRGRIDDTYASLGRPRLKPTRRDLRLALDAVCAGKPVAVARTTALGCYIEG
jgi:thiol-disulfide isomerase/thioredoxin